MVAPNVGGAVRSWRGRVMYEVYPASFCAARGGRVGDLAGIQARLGYLQGLGVDVVWITPFYPSPWVDGGYDVADYCNVGGLFGTMRDFDALVREAHERGIRIVLDLVVNHTSDRHPWFQEALRDPNSPKRQWYVFERGRGDGPPNNWRSIFQGDTDGSAWTRVPDEEGVWYLHTFHLEQPDLDWNNPEVRQAMFEVADFWLARGVDGLRLDYVAGVAKDPKLRDNPPHPYRVDWVRWPDMSERYTAYTFAMYRALAEFVARLGQRYPEAFFFPEAYPDRVGVDPHVYDGFYGSLDPRFGAPFNFALMLIEWKAAAVQAYLDEFYGAVLPEGATAVWVLSNHDRSRLVSRLGEQQARVALALLLTLPGLACLYQGDELGLADAGISPDQWVDPEGREQYRATIPWTDRFPNRGFSTGDVEPLLPVDASVSSVARQRSDLRSVLSFVRLLIALRRTTPALSSGEYVAADSGVEGVLQYGCRLDGELVTVVLNFANEPRWVEWPSGTQTVLFSTREWLGVDSRWIDLEPGGVIVLR